MEINEEANKALFKPLTIGSMTVANRVVMSPMTRSFSPDGVPGEDVAAYYRRRAEGGTGLLITEGVGIDHPSAIGEGRPGKGNVPHMYGEQALSGWRRVVDEVHRVGGKIITQLWHQGAFKLKGAGPFPDAAPCFPAGTWGPRGRNTSTSSEALARMTMTGEAMSESDIAEVIDAYARSAANAKKVGFDGIELHGAHGYLIDSFLWNETNTRNDAWGGDIAGRGRFAVAVVKAIRRQVGTDFPIFFRFSQWKQQDFDARLANSPAELEAILGPLADAGVDVFDASTRYFDQAEFAGSDLNLAGWAKKVTGKLSMTVGGIGLNKGFYDSRRDGRANGVDNIPLLLKRYERNEFDLIGVGRSLLADPEWTLKLYNRQPFHPFYESAIQELR